jgi:hypothetical protein
MDSFKAQKMLQNTRFQVYATHIFTVLLVLRWLVFSCGITAEVQIRYNAEDISSLFTDWKLYRN